MSDPFSMLRTHGPLSERCTLPTTASAGNASSVPLGEAGTSSPEETAHPNDVVAAAIDHIASLPPSQLAQGVPEHLFANALGQAAAKGERSGAPASIDRSIAVARARFGIPGASESHAGRDGWRVSQTTVEGKERVRYIGLVRWQEGALVEHVRVVLERASEQGVSAHVKRSLAEAERGAGRAIDRSLVVAIATRESNWALSRSGQRIDSYSESGLDNLYAVRDQLPLTPELRARLGDATPPGTVRRNERGQAVHPASIPASDMLAIAGAYVVRAQDHLQAEMRAAFGREEGQRAYEAMSPGARRAWTQIAFGGPYGARYSDETTKVGGAFGLRTALGRVRATGAGMESVFTDKWLGQFHRVRRARVTAAEAEIFDKHLPET